MEEPQRKKLLYRAMHRGFKEADIVLGTFAERNLPAMNRAQLDEFERLLEVSDRDLYAWIIKDLPTPSEYKCEVMEMHQSFSVIPTLQARL